MKNRRPEKRTACFFRTDVPYLFLKVEHSVSAQQVQSESRPAWLFTLIESAVQ